MLRKLLLLSTFALFLSASSSAQGSCDITNVVVEAHPCIDGFFLVDIDFDIQDPEGDIFGVVGNATNYGFFEYDSLPITIGPLEGDGITEWEFIIYDLGEPNCQETYELGIVDCCSFNNITLNQIVCTGLESFRARLNFVPENTGNVGFNVYDENEVLLGFFPYNALPVTVNNIPSEGIREMFITICDAGNPNCCTDYYFQDPDCNPNDCEIYNLVAIPGDCDNGEFSVTLNFNFENVSNSFTVVGNGNNYGTFQYSSLPLTLEGFEGDGETVYEFLVSDSGGGGCTAVTVVQPILCPIPCGFYEMEADPQHCQTNESYSLWLNFVPIQVGDDGFTVFTQGENLGSFSYEDVPLVIENFPASGEFFDLVSVCDNADPTCCDTIQFQALRCDECQIYNLTADPTLCDSNDQFFVTLDFDYWLVSDSFQIGGNGNNYGHFSYDQVPVTLGPFDGDSVFFNEFVVIDLGGGFCLAGVEMGVVDCDCGFENINVDPVACTGNGSYSLLLDFTPIEVMNTHFDVYAGDELIGFFAYEDLPVLVENFPESDGAQDVITICDNDNPTCCVSYEFTGLSCGCEIGEVSATPLECDTATQTFALVIDFVWNGDSVETFTVWMGDEEVGQVSGMQLPDTLYGLTSPGGAETIVVCANEISDCCADAVIEVPAPCGEEPCSVTDLVVEVSECSPETHTFDLVVDFNFTGEGVAFFDIFLNGESIAFVAGSSLPVTLSGFESEGGGALIKVCANDNPECCDMVEVQLPVCPEPCDITEMVAEAFACDTLSETFALYLDFDYTGVTDLFDLYLGGDYIGVIDGTTLPDTIYGLTSEGGGELVQVCAQNNPECCAAREIVVDGPCGEIPCAIYDLEVEVLPCDTLSETFGIVLNFAWDGDTEFFDVVMSGQQIAFIEGANLPDTIYGLISDGGGELIRVCANDDPECCDQVEVVIPEPCGIEPCDITAFSVEVLECNNETGTFAIVVSAEWEGNIEFFDLFIGGEAVAFIPSAEMPFTIDGLTSEGGVVGIALCANDRPDCCAEIEREFPECPEECSIFEVVTDNGDCTGDSTFTLFVAYEHNGLTQDSVEIWTGDTYLGTFHIGSQPVVFTDFPWNGNSVMPLRICEKDNPECCRVIEFEVPNCLGFCDIQEIIVEALGTCNPDSATFPVFLNIDWAGDVPGFNIYAGDELILFVATAELPVTIEHFPLPEGDNAVIEVCAFDLPDCCAVQEFDAPDCADSCRIFEVFAENVSCHTDITLSATLNFETEFLNGDVEIWANDIYLGTFPNITPLFVQNIPASDGPIHLLICSEDNPECCGDVTIEGMECGNCTIADLTVMPSECDSTTFIVTLDFEFGNVGEGFTVVGNGTQYGTFEYSQLPIELGPFEGDSITEWEFLVQDLGNPACLDIFDLGIIYCDTTTGIVGIPEVQALEILYGSGGPYFTVPEGAETMAVWAYDGRQVAGETGLAGGEIVKLSHYLLHPGLYFVQVQTAQGVYVGKVVGIE